MQEWIYDSILKAFSGYILRRKVDDAAELAPNYFAAQLHTAVRDALINFRSGCDALLKRTDTGIDTSSFAFEANKYRLYEKNGIEDPVISRTVQLVIARLLIKTPPQTLPLEESGEIYRLWEGAVPYIALSRGNVIDTLQTATDIFSETFADVMACRILAAGIEDYILMHVYEDWDPDFSLELEMVNEYRIPAVIWLCFPDSLDEGKYRLTDACKGRIAAAIDRLERHGMPEKRLNAQEICARVDELLQEFKENEQIAQPILKYLQACLNEYTRLDVWNQLQEYATCFRKIRLLSIDPDSDDVDKHLTNMYYALIQ